MVEDKDEPNIGRIVWSKLELDILELRRVADFSTPQGQQQLHDLLNSPEGVKHWLEYAIGNCWLALPQHKRTHVVLAREMRNLLELTVENLHAHPEAFGIEDPPADPFAQVFRHDRFLGPTASLMLHLAAETCVSMLPPEGRNVIVVERDLRMLFDQTLAQWLANPPAIPQ